MVEFESSAPAEPPGCPRCGRPLKTMRTPDTITVHSCLPCRGMWLDADEARRVGWSEGFSHAAEFSPVEWCCPRCNTAMSTYFYNTGSSELSADVCENCFGAWIDQNTLKPLGVYLESFRQQAVSAAAEAVEPGAEAAVDAVTQSRVTLTAAPVPKPRVSRKVIAGSSAGVLLLLGGIAYLFFNSIDIGPDSGPHTTKSALDEAKKTLQGVGGGKKDVSKEAEPTTAATEGDVAVENGPGRSGRYYLPAGYDEKPLPLLVVLHGTNGTARDMIDVFRAAAKERSFAVLAPESRAVDGGFSWAAADQAEGLERDLQHILACVRKMKETTKVEIDAKKILLAGYSGGAAIATYAATRDPMFAAFAVLHGTTFAEPIGSHRPRGWFSGGDSDTLQPLDHVRRAADGFRERASDAQVEFRMYSGGHTMTTDERREVINWWLSG